MERTKRWKKTNLCSYWNNNRGRYYHATCLILLSIGLIGCTTLKKAGIVGIAGGSGALAGGLVSSGVLAPVAGAVVTSAVADVVTEVTQIGNTGKETMSECAGDNFWTLLGQIVEMGGYFLLLLVFVPMVIGWVLPGPLERKKKGSS